MPLTFDYTAVATDTDEVLIEAGVWATMAVGINHITVENARDFYARVNFAERVQGAFRRDGGGNEVRFTPEDVLNLVGLRTNATPLTPTKFRNNLYENHTRWNVPRGVF